MSEATARPSSLGQSREVLCLAAVLLLATILRCGWPRLTEFKFSEARLASLAMEVTQEGRLPLVGVPSSAGFDHSPISVYLYVPAFLFGSDPIPATVYGGLVGVLAVALCWWLARRWPGGGAWAALITALLFATSPWAVAFSRKIWQVVFVLVLSPAFIGLLVSAMIQKRHWHLTWAIAVFALLVQVHPSAISLAPAILLWAVVFWRELRFWPILAGFTLAAVSALPFLLHQYQAGWPMLNALGSLSETVWDLTSIRLSWDAITGRGLHALAGLAYPDLQVVPQIGWFFNLVGWLLVASALWLGWRAIVHWRSDAAGKMRASRLDFVLLTWLMVPIAFNLRHGLDLHLHFFALVMPAAYLIIGRAGQGLLHSLGSLSRGRSRQIAASLGLVLLALAQVVALALMARFVAANPTPGGFGVPLGHYLDATDAAIGLAEQDEAAELLIVGQGDSPVVDDVPAIFDALLRGRSAYRFVDGESAALFPAHKSIVVLTPGAGGGASWYGPWPASETGDVYGRYDLIKLQGGWPTDGLQEITGPRLFQNGIEVQSFRWDDDPIPGRAAQLWLMGQVLWQEPEDSHFTVRLLDADGHLIAQHDVAGSPSASRIKGDRVILVFDINVPTEAPEGPYRIQVGQYSFPEIVSIPVVDANGTPLTDVVVIGE